jgi:hypothetical protein
MRTTRSRCDLGDRATRGVRQAVLRALVTGAVVGLLAGVACGAAAPMSRGLLFWGWILALIAAVENGSGLWILRQSRDIPKMRMAMPLTGAVLASLACVATGESFLPPVLASVGAGLLLPRLPPLRGSA